MSKDLFHIMREREVATNNFLPTKKDIQKSSKDLAKEIINSGNYNLQEVFSQSIRIQEAISVISDEIKKKLPDENFEAFGIKGIFRNGGDTINFKDDEVWSDLKKKLEERETLLKASLSVEQIFYDSEGVEVPKVSKTPRKSSLSISF